MYSSYEFYIDHFLLSGKFFRRNLLAQSRAFTADSFPETKRARREAVGAGAKKFARANDFPLTHCPHFKLARFRLRIAIV